MHPVLEVVWFALFSASLFWCMLSQMSLVGTFYQSSSYIYLLGLLWNLSSTDELKEDLIHEALPVLTDCVIIPFSGWTDGISARSREIVDPEVFFNATGCLR